MKVFARVTFFIAILLLYSSLNAYAVPPIAYLIDIDASDLAGFNVEMRVPNSSGVMRVAMAVHPEYDDRYWRYVENFSAVDRSGRLLKISKESDTVWRIEAGRGETIIRYRLHLPAEKAGVPHDAWKPFLTEYGGMVGDLHSLMYVVGRERARSRLTLIMPQHWKAASGLEPTRSARTFTGSAELLLDSPVMIGNLLETDFVAGGIPHKVVFWTSPNGPAFERETIVGGVRKIVDEAIRAYGPPPYKRYAFLFQNGGQAGLEHLTSVNLGVSSDLGELFEDTAHEYSHAWNLMDVRPKQRVGIKYRFAEPATVLWWNEGATIMFADLLIRRAGLPGDSRPRLKRLEASMVRYLSSPGYYTLSAEQVSRGDSHPLLLGNTFASTHLQGEVLATMLDFKIRDATDGRKNVLDVMKLLAARFDFRHGIANADIEKAIADVCACESRSFFHDYIYGASRVDFEKYLGLIGVRAEIGTAPAVGGDGKPSVDLRISPLPFDTYAGPGLKVRITNPQSAWGRAGINTGDVLLSINGTRVNGWDDLRSYLRSAKIGDTARLVMTRDARTREVIVPISGYEIATVRLIEIPNATAKQIRLRNAWAHGQ